MKISNPTHVLHVKRAAIERDRVVYVLVANKQFQYKLAKSSIAYIGTTGTGIQRLAKSVAERAPDLLKMHGVRSFDVHVVAPTDRPEPKSYEMLETAMLIMFRERFHELPKLNIKGIGMSRGKEFDFFADSRISKIIDDLSKPQKGSK